MSNTVEVRINWGAVESEVKAHILTAQAALDTAIINDTDGYVPFRQGTLAGSVHTELIGTGNIVYDTPYARHLYYGVDVRTGRKFNFGKTFHPDATEKWFEVAKDRYLEKWINQVKEAMKR